MNAGWRGVDFKVSYVPLQNNQFRSFTWGTELLYSDNRYLADPDTSIGVSAGIPATNSPLASIRSADTPM